MSIRVKDADDQNPVFSQDVYRATVSETASITVSLKKTLLKQGYRTHIHNQGISPGHEDDDNGNKGPDAEGEKLKKRIGGGIER